MPPVRDQDRYDDLTGVTWDCSRCSRAATVALRYRSREHWWHCDQRGWKRRYNTI